MITVVLERRIRTGQVHAFEDRSLHDSQVALGTDRSARDVGIPQSRVDDLQGSKPTAISLVCLVETFSFRVGQAAGIPIAAVHGKHARS